MKRIYYIPKLSNYVSSIKRNALYTVQDKAIFKNKIKPSSKWAPQKHFGSIFLLLLNPIFLLQKDVNKITFKKEIRKIALGRSKSPEIIMFLFQMLHCWQ